MKHTHYQTASFNPYTFSPIDGLDTSEILQYWEYLERGLISTPHSTFNSSEEIALIISKMKKLDPLLAILCHLSHKYTLHPIHQIGLACLGSGSRCIQLGNGVDYKKTEMELSKSDWQLVQPYISSIYIHQHIFLYQNSHYVNAAEELNTRWRNVCNRLINFGVIDHTISLFSYFSTALGNEEFKAEPFLNILDHDDFNRELYFKLLYASFGRDAPIAEIINYSPPNPFDYNIVKMP
jgi:hypothetical protein